MYKGQIAHIPLGELGLLTDRPPSQVPRGALIKAFNVSYETGSLTKAPGSLRYNINQALPAGILALHDYWPNTIAQRLIAACSDGAIYRDIGDRTFSGATAIASGLNPFDASALFVEGGQETAGRDKKLFFFSSTNQVQVLSGDETTFADIENPAADWVSPNFPNVALVHRNRLWAFQGQRAYASNTGDHEDFTSSFLTQSIFPGEGGDITGAFVFRGRLFAFKEGSFVYYLDESNSDSSNWFWVKLASNFGLASPHGIVQVANDMIAVNESGSPISYNAVESFGDIESADLLRLLEIEDYYRHNSSLAGINLTHAMYYEAKKQLFFTARSSYRNTNDMLFHLDFNKRSPRAALWNKDQANCLSLRKDINKVLRPIYGSDDGYVYLMDKEDRLVNTGAYDGNFKIGHIDFRWMDESVAQKNKLFDFLDLEFVPQGDWNVSIDVFIDGTFRETLTIEQKVREDGLDTFTLGSGGSSGLKTPSGGDGDPLGREETQTIRRPLHGSGRRISFHVRQAGANQNFQISGLSVGFRLSAEQASRAGS